MNETKKRSSNRRHQIPHRNHHMVALVSRVIPLLILAIGSLWWMGSMQVAMGQFSVPPPGNQIQAQPYPEAYIATAPPTIPSAAMPTETPAQPAEPVAEEATLDATGWIAKIAQGGWLMIPLAVFSLIVIALSVERMIALRRGRVIPRPFVRRFTECVEDGQLSYDEATELCEEFDCPVAEVFRAAVRRWGRPMLEIEQAVVDAGDRVADGLRRFLRVFHAVSNVAPLVGLLGTVLGMIEAFETISNQESIGRPELLASGISKALMTTAGGLLVAIPAYLAYMYFSSKADRYLGEIDRLCQKVIECISAEGLEVEKPKGNRKRRAA
ncbi:MAG: MotA/TolQ/ExbB proton channel family protein [Rubripirellula sp.]